jgi:hypothetical protein
MNLPRINLLLRELEEMTGGVLLLAEGSSIWLYRCADTSRQRSICMGGGAFESAQPSALPWPCPYSLNMHHQLVPELCRGCRLCLALPGHLAGAAPHVEPAFGWPVAGQRAHVLLALGLACSQLCEQELRFNIVMSSLHVAAGFAVGLSQGC